VGADSVSSAVHRVGTHGAAAGPGLARGGMRASVGVLSVDVGADSVSSAVHQVGTHGAAAGPGLAPSGMRASSACSALTWVPIQCRLRYTESAPMAQRLAPSTLGCAALESA
jgi:hypothetical protein